MDETIIFPSPNWFQASGFAVSTDNWLVYGGPSKSLCVLEPLPHDFQGHHGYRAHVQYLAHSEKINCIDISPEWSTKRTVLTGGADGVAKQWILEQNHGSLQIKSTHSHEIHKHDNEDVIGVGYFSNGYAVTVGGHGNIVKWDLNSNVTKSYSQVLKGFKPVCMSCSPHIHMNIAVGTKQGVIFVFDLNGTPRVLYKVRGQDDEIIQVSWCPQYEVHVNKSIDESERRSVAMERMGRIRNEPEDPRFMKELDKRVRKAITQLPKDNNDIKILVSDKLSEEIENPVEKVLSEKRVESIAMEIPSLVDDDEVLNKSTSDKLKDNELLENKEQREVAENRVERVFSDQKVSERNTIEISSSAAGNELLDESGICKTLPEDSFDESIVAEDDMFDIYKDHEADEFGHKKYESEEIVVKIKDNTRDNDYLAECKKLKEQILKRKDQAEASIESLVSALDKTKVDDENIDELNELQKDSCGNSQGANSNAELSSIHVHKHLVASIGRYGSVRVWSKSGKLMASCTVNSSGCKKEKHQRTVPHWATLLWYKPNILLLADGKGQLLQCDPLKIDCKSKLNCFVVHRLHKRGIFVIASNAPQIQTNNLSDDHWSVWTISQDRYFVRYSLKSRQIISKHNTSGGFLYSIESCPYDAKKMAICAGDGAVRVWEADTSDDDDLKLSVGNVTSCWQNVQGKVLTVAWHPTRENCLAFATAESRIGLIDASKPDKPAKTFSSDLHGPIYSISWGTENDLYACAGSEMVVYKADKPDERAKPVNVDFDGQRFESNAVHWYPHGMLCGNLTGTVAVVNPTQPHTILAAAIVFNKMIHTMEWHPQETSNSSDGSPYKNLIAVCSLDKSNDIVILEYGNKEGGGKQLTVWKTLSGHSQAVLKIAWNPHVEGQLLSTSRDATVRVWNIAEGVCTSIFGGHLRSTLAARFSSFPQHATKVISGGGDCCLRVWDITKFPADAYKEHSDVDVPTRRERKRKDRKEKKPSVEPIVTEDYTAAISEAKLKPSKKFLLSLIYRQINPCKINGPRKMLQKYLGSSNGNTEQSESKINEYDLDYLKLFGTINELNEVLDDEAERHQDTGNLDAWTMLCIFRGHIDHIVQYASQRDQLDPFLLSITPCVSFKYWKDVTQLYITQIDRLAAKEADAKLYETRYYGGPIYRKVAALLSLHDVRGAVNVLWEARLFKEAYVLCRTRYIDSIAQETLMKWAEDAVAISNLNLGAVCYIALGNLPEAAKVLGKSKNEQSLMLAADIAKIVGQKTFADHIEKKREQIISVKEENIPKPLEEEQLPSRTELLVKTQTERNNDTTTEFLEKLPSKMDKNDKSDGPSEELPSKMGKNDNIDDALEELPSKMDKNDKTDNPLEELPSKMDKNDKTDDALEELPSKMDKNDKTDDALEELQSKMKDNDKTADLLEDLPSKMENLMKNDNSQNDEEVKNEQNGKENGNVNGNHVNV